MNPSATLVTAACLVLSTALLAQDEALPLTAITEQIRTQYEAIDDRMLQQPYDTRSLVQRRDDDPRLELTTFRPSRPAGEREQLERVNGEAPGRSDLRRFNRRPQPDARDEQPIRLRIDYATLELVADDGAQLRFRFQPVLLLEDEPSEYSDRFRGELLWNRDDRYLARVEMVLAQPFSYRLFNVDAFSVTETFRPVGNAILRDIYAHDIELRNRLLDLSNSAEIEFTYPSDAEVLHSRR